MQKLLGLAAMAEQAQGPQIFEIALTSALDDGHDVVRVPETFSRHSFEAPSFQQLQPQDPSRTAKFRVGSLRIGAADGADAVITLEDFLAKIAGVGAKTPFMHAPIRAEGEPAGRNFQIAPPAQGSAVFALDQRVAVCCPTGHGSGGARDHNIFSIRCFDFYS